MLSLDAALNEVHIFVKGFFTGSRVCLQDDAVVMGLSYQYLALVMGPLSGFSEAHVNPPLYKGYPPRSQVSIIGFNEGGDFFYTFVNRVDEF